MELNFVASIILVVLLVLLLLIVSYIFMKTIVEDNSKVILEIINYLNKLEKRLYNIEREYIADKVDEVLSRSNVECRNKQDEIKYIIRKNLFYLNFLNFDIRIKYIKDDERHDISFLLGLDKHNNDIFYIYDENKHKRLFHLNKKFKKFSIFVFFVILFSNNSKLKEVKYALESIVNNYMIEDEEYIILYRWYEKGRKRKKYDKFIIVNDKVGIYDNTINPDENEDEEDDL